MNSPAILPPNQALPGSLRAGDRLAWSVRTQLPPGTVVWFALSAVINNAPARILVGSQGAQSTVDPVEVDDNGVAVFDVPSATSTTWQPGRYQWVGFAVDASGNRTEFGNGTVEILPDPGSATPVESRSYNQKMLDAIRAVRLGEATEAVASYKVGTRELVKYTPEQLRSLEAEFEVRVRRERISNGQYVPTKTLGVSFGGR